MKLKTMDLELLLTFDHMWKILVWLLRPVFWFVNTLLSFESSICISSEYLINFIISIDIKIWMGNIPINNHFDFFFVVSGFESSYLIN